MPKVSLLILLIGTMLVTQAQDHAPVPDYCVNHDVNHEHPADTEHACFCHRGCATDEGGNPLEDPQCKTWCKPERCECAVRCEEGS